MGCCHSEQTPTPPPVNVNVVRKPSSNTQTQSVHHSPKQGVSLKIQYFLDDNTLQLLELTELTMDRRISDVHTVLRKQKGDLDGKSIILVYKKEKMEQQKTLKDYDLGKMKRDEPITLLFG